MATLTNEQIEQKKQLLEEKTKKMKAIYDELVEAGAIELSDEDLDQAAGGFPNFTDLNPLNGTPMTESNSFADQGDRPDHAPQPVLRKPIIQ